MRTILAIATLALACGADPYPVVNPQDAGIDAADERTRIARSMCDPILMNYCYEPQPLPIPDDRLPRIAATLRCYDPFGFDADSMFALRRCLCRVASSTTMRFASTETINTVRAECCSRLPTPFGIRGFATEWCSTDVRDASAGD